jgi:acetyl esterase/lipase
MPLVCGGCAGLINGTTPTAGLNVARNVPYGADAAQVVDVYAPAATSGAPVVVFIHGGSWETGDPGMYTFLGAALAARGIVAVLAGYRLYPQVSYPVFLQDSAQAVAWARDHAAAYGGDQNCLFVMGHSAGAYNAMMLALDPRWLDAVGLAPGTALAGVLGLAGPYDFLPLTAPDIQAVFAPARADLPDTQPINHVSPGAPSAFLAYGTSDTTVKPRNSEALAARLREAGDAVTLRAYPGIDHITLIGAYAWPFRWLAPVLPDSVDFIRQQAAQRCASPAARPPPR